MPWNFGGSSNKSWKEQLEEAYRKAEERRQAGKAPRKSHSSYWLDEEDFRDFSTRYTDPVSQHSPEYLMKLAHVRRGIANFVRIVTGRDIPVHFSTGEQSYAARTKKGDEFIVISATTDPAKFDVNVGTALHEGAHMVLSKKTNLKDSIPLYDWLAAFRKNPEHFLPPVIEKNAKRLMMNVGQVVKLTQDVVNVMEDRRIDKWMYQKAVGYRGYYDAMYEELWHSPRIDSLLLNPITRIPLVKHYQLRFINMTNPFSDPDALPGLRDIFALVDLPNIQRFANDERWSTWHKQLHTQGGKSAYAVPALPEMIQNAIEIVTIILMNSEPPQEIEDEQGVPLPMPPQDSSSQSDKKVMKQKNDPTPDDEDQNNWDIPDAGNGSDPKDIPDQDEDDDEEGEDNDGNAGDSTDSEESEPTDDDEGNGACDNDPTDEEETDDEGTSVDGSDEDDDADEEDVDGEAGGSDSEDDEEAEEEAPAPSASDDKSKTDDKEKKEGTVPTSGPSEYDEKELDKILEEMSKFLNGEIEKEQMAPETQKAMEALESSGASMSVVGGEFSGKAKVIVYHKLTEQLLQSPTFHFVKTSGHKPMRDLELDKAVEEGAQMGNVLAHRVRVMSDESPLTYNRQNNGKIDKRMISGLGYDSENVFEHTFTEKFSPVIVHLTLDSSTSMQGEKWYNAIRLAAALAKCAEKISNLSVVISLRAGGHDAMAHVLIAYDSRVDTFTKIKTMFPYLRADGGTPEGLCFAAIRDIIFTGDRSARKFFVNISDGDPQFDWREPTGELNAHGNPEYDSRSYRDEPAWHHTAQTVNEFRNAGIVVLSYFMETPEGDVRYFYDPQKRFSGFKEKVRYAFKAMYGKDAAFIKPDSVAEIARTLNNMFLQGGK